MERVAEGCWSMLRDVKSTPPTLTLPGYFFSAGLKLVASRSSEDGLEIYVNVRTASSRRKMNNFLLDAKEQQSYQISVIPS